MIETGTLLQNRYLIEKQIGEGGMGAVYLAIDQRFGSTVAIKETFFKDDELGLAFEREAHLLNSLHHPVLPHVSDYFAENNGYFLVMQFIEGEDLFETLKREGAFPVKDVVRWTDQLLDALDYLHSQEPPIIHRDIKPQNLKITARGEVILLDFGLAKLSSEDSSGMKSIFGYSRKYSPLEQIQGTGTDARSDIFALAATAYHLLTGKPPIEVIARASEIIHGNSDPLRLASEINDKIPAGVANVLTSALALNAAKRFASAKAMRIALEHSVIEIPPDTEKLPNPIQVADSVNFETINAAEIENFTALEAFAADAANASPLANEINDSPAIEVPIAKPENLVSSNVVPQNDYPEGLTTNVVTPPTAPRYRVAALAFILICSVFGALFVIARMNSSNDSNQVPTVKTATESNFNAEQPAIIKIKPPAEIIEATAVSENTEQAKVKVSSAEKIVEKNEVAEKPTKEVEPVEKPKPAPPAISRSTPRRNQPAVSGETRPRVAHNEPVPDIESIFTGRSSAERNEIQQRREERRRQREEMSDEELREDRRQRRERRRQRQNRNAIPF